VSRRIGTTRRQGQPQPTPDDTLIEKMRKFALRVKESHSPYITVTLSTDEALRLGPEHVLFFMDNLLAASKANDKKNFVVMRIKLWKDKNNEILSSLKGGGTYRRLGRMYIYNRDLCIDSCMNSTLEIETCPSCRGSEIFIEAIYAPSSDTSYPLANTYWINPENDVMYTNFHTNTKPIKYDFKDRALLAITGVIAFTEGKAVFYSSVAPDTYQIWGIVKMSCNPTIQTVEVNNYELFQVIRKPIECDRFGYCLRTILDRVRDKDYTRSILMLNS
jgi:hypothetical protein